MRIAEGDAYVSNWASQLSVLTLALRRWRINAEGEIHYFAAGKARGKSERTVILNSFAWWKTDFPGGRWVSKINFARLPVIQNHNWKLKK
ncbi:hypothetical protein K1T36_10840 [Pseudomonas protegens]|uniref:hypothetical protein n=1 Tax=Pseudomonas protegens TaxID=380021 RepID=UPI001C69A929|nr:hypothetical protein [Pseudomonas protegens]QYN03615.1 hypothetical protein K1T36_10840 [Pseudomonas protegens]